MILKPQQLTGVLQRGLAPVYLIGGDEPQQLGESTDTVRKAAKDRGFLAREIFFADKQFDWKQLNVASQTLSLFDDKKIIDLKLSGPPGQEGAKALCEFCLRSPEDSLLIVTAGKLTKDAQKSSWFKAIENAGCVVLVWPLSGQELIRWIEDRLQARGLRAEAGAAKLLADRVEGNLLAAAQEVEKLYVLYGEGNLTSAQIRDVVSDSSRYDVFALIESALAGQAGKVLKIIASLKAEGAASLALWAVAREARLISGYKAAPDQRERDYVLKSQGVWGERRQWVDNASKRLSQTDLNRILVLNAKADRQIKGQQTGDPWETLLAACLSLASFPVGV